MPRGGWPWRCTYCARLVDDAGSASDDAARERCADLLGRKVTMHRGRAFGRLTAEIQSALRRAESFEELGSDRDALAHALGCAVETTSVLGEAAAGGRARLALANATEYLHMLGHVVVGWMWLEQAMAAVTGRDAGTIAAEFAAGKVHACRFFCRYELPRVDRQATLLNALDDTTLTMPDTGF